MAPQTIELSIVIPAHNEENRLVPTLETYCGYFGKLYADTYEIIVVANACVDRTAGVARDVAARFREIRVIEEPRPVGKGGALLIGFDVARGAAIGFVDADGSTPPDAFHHLIRHLNGADIVIASRWHSKSTVEPRQPWKRRVASRVFNVLVRLLFGLQVSDTQCGAKVFKRQAYATVRSFLGLTRWAFDVDLLYQFRRHGFRILEIPTVWRDVAGSKLNLKRAAIEMSLAITRLRLLYSPFRFVVEIYDHTLGKIVKLERFL
ncbi:MAG TPA: glycosyltransferase family 2 protein [Kiritimatiellae bacterium]|nr:glycosyltransferase family 2 protein [Kiritimatiellia bacterium]